MKLSLMALSIVAVLTLIFGLAGKSHISDSLGSFSLVVTLGVLIVYAHHTALSAKSSSHPAVSFHIEIAQLEDGPYFQLHMTNLSSYQVRCWCQITPRFRSSPKAEFNPLRMSEGMDFYEGKSPCDILPQQKVNGASFLMTVFFGDEGMDYWNAMVDNLNNGRGFPRLYLDVDFWYEAEEIGFRSRHLIQQYYYDFRIQKLILDF